MKYLVTYDLNKAGQNYDDLIDAIQSFPNVHAMQSVWFVKSSGSATDVYNHLKKHIDRNDHIFVCEVTSNRNGWMPQKIWDFLGS